MQQIEAVANAAPERVIILTGDKVLNDHQIQQLRAKGINNKIIRMEEYWNTPDWKDKQMGSENRRAQNQLLKLLGEENDAISIGMGSGGLESSALLGNKTIFMDDTGNAAAPRMEMWSGEASRHRGDYLQKGKSYEEMVKYEQEQEGTIPNYRRIETANKLGNKIDERLEQSEHIEMVINDTGSQKRTELTLEQKTAIKILEKIADSDILNQTEKINPNTSKDIATQLDILYKAEIRKKGKQSLINKHELDDETKDAVKRCLDYLKKNGGLLESEKEQISFLIKYWKNN